MAPKKLKHEQVAEHIEALICAGEIAPGDALPSEYVLAEEFAVSRGTVRKALSKLKNRKLVRSDQGRGSFVTFHNQRIDDRQGWAEALSSAGAEMTVQTLSISQVKEPALAAYAGGNADFVKVVRTRTLPSGTVASLETSLLPATEFISTVPTQGLVDGSITKTLYRAGLFVEHGEELVDVVVLDPTSAALLGREPGKAFMRVVRRALTSQNFLAEQVTSLLDPDHFRFRNVFNRQKEREEG